MKAGKKANSVILRADGNNQIGLGHVYRLLALAEMLKSDFDCFFAINDPDLFTLNQIEKTCKNCIRLKSNIVHHVPDLDKPGEEITFDLPGYISGNGIVVTDGYLFGEKYQLAVKATGAKLICIDDLAETDFYADVIINHAPGVDAPVYKKQEYTKLYTGLDYAILRQPFFNRLPKRKNAASGAFISMGGSDYYGYSKKLLELILSLDQFENINLLCSSVFSAELLKSLKELEARSKKIKLHFNLDASRLVEILDTCSHAFVAASTVLMEAYSRGLKCFAGFYSKNQQFMYNGFVKSNMAVATGNFNNMNKERIIAAIEQEHTIKPLTSAVESQKNITRLFDSLL